MQTEARVVTRWLERFEAALAKNDLAAVEALFHKDCAWRDLVAFTWNIVTCEGVAEVRAMLAATLPSARPSRFEQRGLAQPGEAWFSFETLTGRGIGHLRLRDERCVTLLTTLQELKGFEEKAARTRPLGVEPGVLPERQSWLERRQALEAALRNGTRQPYVVIVGGGQGGIALAARLKRLDVPAVIVEKNARAGDSWRKRYKSLCLHDPVWYDHLPYIPFPEHWPVFSPKDKIADWLEMYVRVMELSYWGGTACTHARFDEQAGEWQVEAVDAEGRPLVLRPKHLVIATGMSGFPYLPKVPGAESFTGKLVHSSQYEDAEPWRGKRCVVVGSGTSAHDLCADLWEHAAAEVTMVQRSSTIVARSETLRELAWGKLYSEEALERGITTGIADLTLASVPFRLLPKVQKPVYDAMLKRDAPFYEGLRRAGFLFDMGEDGSGLHAAYLRRGAGYYIDVGASQLLVDGRVKLKSPASVERLNTRSVLLSDGSELAADLVVFATGYDSMSRWAAELVSPQVAEKVGRVWGYGSGTKGDPGPWEGELRNMWKPTAQPNLWFHGGNLMQSRHYSLYLALQLKARYENLGVRALGQSRSPDPN